MTLDRRLCRLLIGALAVAIVSPGVAEPSQTAAVSEACAAALRTAGVVANAAADFIGDSKCSIEEPVTVAAIETTMGGIALPAHPDLECRFAAALGVWIREVVSPVTAALMGSPVVRLSTGPGHQCRVRSGAQTRLSEHATGNAIDISAIVLGDGRSVAVARLLEATGAERTLLDAISTSACGYFTTVLGPGSDPAHADHLHLDLATRSNPNYRICMAR